MKFVKLTQSNDVPIFINIGHIKEMYVSISKESTTIIFSDNHTSSVKETPEQILSASEIYIYNNFK